MAHTPKNYHMVRSFEQHIQVFLLACDTHPNKRIEANFNLILNFKLSEISTSNLDHIILKKKKKKKLDHIKNELLFKI